MDENSMQIALGKLSPQDNDVIVVKFNKDSCRPDNLQMFMNALKDICPCPVVAISDDMDIGTENIDRVIDYLQSMKKS